MIEQAALVCEGDSGGHPGLMMLEDLNLISSAGSGDQLFGAFLYSNACVVAGLRAAARLATQLGMNGSAGRWIAHADRIWNDGILQGRSPPAVRAAPGMIDPDSGRFLQARRLSKIRGLWTDDPEFLIDQSTTLDINMLALAVPFGLLPAADPRLVRIAESILRANEALKGDSNVLARTTYEPPRSDRSGSQQRSARRVQPGDALDGPVLDPARARDRPGPALVASPRHARRRSSAGSPSLACRCGRPAAASNRPARSPTRAEPPGDCTPC